MRRLPLLHLSLIFLCMLPATMIVPVLKDIIKDRLGGGNATVSFFVSIAMLGAFLFGPVAGYISDRMRKRSGLIAVAALLDAICFFGMVQVGEIWLLLLIRFLEGAVSITVIGLLLAAITDRENNPSNPVYFQKGILMGLAGLLLSLGVGLGLPLGILGQADPRLPFYTAALLMLITGILALHLPESESIHTSRGQLSRLNVALRERPLILIPFAFAFVDRFTVGFLVSAFNLHLRESLAFGPGLAGAYLGLVLLPMALLSPPGAWLARKIGTQLPVYIGSVIYGVFLSLAGLNFQPHWISVFLLIAGIGAGLMFVPSMMMAARMAPVGYNATVMSGFMGSGSLGFMLGPLAAIALSHIYFSVQDSFPFVWLTASFGGLEILLVLATIPLYERLKRLMHTQTNTASN